MDHTTTINLALTIVSLLNERDGAVTTAEAYKRSLLEIQKTLGAQPNESVHEKLQDVLGRLAENDENIKILTQNHATLRKTNNDLQAESDSYMTKWQEVMKLNDNQRAEIERLQESNEELAKRNIELSQKLNNKK